MAELTNLESKLGEVTGLAMAAQVATAKVLKLPGSEEGELVSHLERMQQEAKETEDRCTALLSGFARSISGGRLPRARTDPSPSFRRA